MSGPWRLVWGRRLLLLWPFPAACPLVAEVEAVAEGPCEGPWLLVMPRRSLSIRASPGGLPVPVGCPVLSVWPRRAFLSCFVLSCLFSPGGLLIPPHFPREFFFWGGGGGGSKSSGCRGRAEGTEAKAPEDHLPWPPEPPAPPWPPEPPAPPWPPELPAPPWHPELPAPPWSLSVCSALEVPVLRSCLCLSWWARAPTPPPPWWNFMWVMSGFCCVCYLLLPLVSIFGLFPVLVSCHYELIRVQLCVCDCVNYPVYLVPVFWVWFRLVYSLLPGVSCLSAVSCPALMSWLNTIIWVYALVCVSLFLPRVCTVTI